MGGLKIKIGSWNPVQSIQNTIRDPLGEGAKAFENTTLPGALAAGYIGKAPKPPSPGEDPNVTALRQRLFGEAQDFDKNLGNYQSSASNQIQSEGDMALQSGVKNNNQNFNRRGLLYSGLREAGEQGVKGRVASAMSQQKAQSNKDLSDMSTAKYQKAAQVGLQGYQDAVNREAEIAGINLQNQVLRAQQNQQLGELGGTGVGLLYSNSQNGNSSAPQPTQGYGGVGSSRYASGDSYA